LARADAPRPATRRPRAGATRWTPSVARCS
jgi:hypothetical protein